MTVSPSEEFTIVWNRGLRALGEARLYEVCKSVGYVLYKPEEYRPGTVIPPTREVIMQAIEKAIGEVS